MSGATGDLRISGGFNSNTMLAKDPKLMSVPQLQKWENINPINDYIQTAMMQAQLDTEKARVEAFKENMALDRDRFEHTKSNDAILNAIKEKELALNTRKEDREDYQFNNLSAKDKLLAEIENAKMRNNERVAGIHASARSSGGNSNGNIQRDWNTESSIRSNYGNKNFIAQLEKNGLNLKMLEELRKSDYVGYLTEALTALKQASIL